MSENPQIPDFQKFPPSTPGQLRRMAWDFHHQYWCWQTIGIYIVVWCLLFIGEEIEELVGILHERR